MWFSDEIESVFTRKDLEKTPTAEVVQFVPPVGVNMYVLSPEEEQTLQKTMHRLAERVLGTIHTYIRWTMTSASIELLFPMQCSLILCTLVSLLEECTIEKAVVHYGQQQCYTQRWLV